MKRIIAIVICFLLMCGFPERAAAAGSGIYENAGALYNAWVTGDCVPDYITAVISTDGGTDNLTFGLVEGEAGEAGRQEIYDLVRDDASVTIMYQTYSRNALYRIQEEVVDTYFGKDLGLVTAGVSEGANKLLFEIKSSYSENPDTLAMIEEVTAKYGDAVSFRFTNAQIEFVVDVQTAPARPLLVMNELQKPAMPLGFPLALCAAAAALMLLEMRRRRMVAAAVDGAQVTAAAKDIGMKEIEEAVRNAQSQPPASLDERVMHTIEQKLDP